MTQEKTFKNAAEAAVERVIAQFDILQDLIITGGEKGEDKRLDNMITKYNKRNDHLRANPLITRQKPK